MATAAKNAELQQYEEEILQAGSKGPRAEAIRRYLKVVRDLKLRKPDIVAKFGAQLIFSPGAKTLPQEELWLVYEQVTVAACDCQAISIAAACVKALDEKFPESARAGRLQGMLHEAKGEHDLAEALYKTLLESQPASQLVLKRLVGLKQSRGDLTGAISEMNNYLQHYQADHDAWQELGSMYVKLHMYRQAAFCYEELLLAQPTHFENHVAYADIMFTLGGIDNLRTARAYYSSAVELSSARSVRALYGLCCCTAAMRNLKGAKLSEDEMQLPLLAANMLGKLYKASTPSKLPLVQGLLDSWDLKEEQ